MPASGIDDGATQLLRQSEPFSDGVSPVRNGLQMLCQRHSVRQVRAARIVAFIDGPPVVSGRHPNENRRRETRRVSFGTRIYDGYAAS